MMQFISRSARRLGTMAALGLALAAPSAFAQSYTYNFSTLAAGTNLGTTAFAGGTSFLSGSIQTRLDALGNTQSFWAPDATLPAVLVGNAAASAGGAALVNGMDATNGAVFMQLNSSYNITSFGFTQDAYKFTGDPLGGELIFVDSLGNTVSQLTFNDTAGTAGFNQTLSFASPGNNVAGIVIAGLKVFSSVNVGLAPVPEPSQWAMMAVGLAVMLTIAGRRTRA